MVNWPIQITMPRRGESGETIFRTHYEGSCNASDVTEDNSGTTAQIDGTPEDAAGGSAAVCIENGKVFLYDEENENWRKQFSFQE